jgi:hypothetical protein
MMMLRSIVVSAVLLAACNPDAPPPAKAAPAEAAPAKAPGTLPAKRLPPGDPHAEPPPGEDPPVRDVMPTAKGTFDVTLEGKLVHYLSLPRGWNRAIALPEGKIGRVMLGASESDAGLPSLRITIEGLRPDEAQYPLTIGREPAADDAKADDAKAGEAKPGEAKPGPSLSVRYEVNEHRIYVLDPAKGADVQLTLEAFEGSTLRGHFKGKLAPTAAGLGAPIPISGTLAIELGLQGVKPGPAAPAQPPL